VEKTKNYFSDFLGIHQKSARKDVCARQWVDKFPYAWAAATTPGTKRSIGFSIDFDFSLRERKSRNQFSKKQPGPGEPLCVFHPRWRIKIGV
jgi:hypothetical protein